MNRGNKRWARPAAGGVDQRPSNPSRWPKVHPCRTRLNRVVCGATPCGAFAAILLAVLPAHAEQLAIELELNGRRLEGTPLAWSAKDVFLLARDGKVWNFAPHEAKDFRKHSTEFRSFSQGDLRNQLLREFNGGQAGADGRAAALQKNAGGQQERTGADRKGTRNRLTAQSVFEVSGTGHYLVVHPAGQRDVWAPRFEELYRSFVQYFSARGWRPEAPQFPLIAVAFPNEQDFLRYAQNEGARLVPGTLGYYSPMSNRILLYDVAASANNESLWHINAGTIIHEATHQTAFNCGMHSRFAVPPLWVAEGMATLFEAPGVWNPRAFAKPQDRLNRERLTAFQKYAANRRKAGSLADFVASDGLFQSDIEAAYAQSWALTYFLVETMPRKYLDFLRATASRPNFTDYAPSDRSRDFAKFFGKDLSLVESHFLRFIRQIK